MATISYLLCIYVYSPVRDLGEDNSFAITVGAGVLALVLTIAATIIIIRLTKPDPGDAAAPLIPASSVVDDGIPSDEEEMSLVMGNSKGSKFLVESAI